MEQRVPCYYMPKQIMTSDYSDYSVECKLLFSMIFTNAQHIKTIIETAKLSENIGEKELYNMHRLFEKDVVESEEV